MMSEDVLIRDFAGPNAAYCSKVFSVIQSSPKLTWTFNPAAMLFGALWAGARGLWFLFFLLIFLDLAALGPIVQSVQGGVNFDLNTQLQQLEGSVAKRRSEATIALADGNASKAATSTKLADNLQKVADAARLEARKNAEGATERLLLGLAAFGLTRIAAGFAANLTYERRYTVWRANRGLPHALPFVRIISTFVQMAAIYGILLYSMMFSHVLGWLMTFLVANMWYEASETLARCRFYKHLRGR